MCRLHESLVQIGICRLKCTECTELAEVRQQDQGAEDTGAEDSSGQVSEPTKETQSIAPETRPHISNSLDRQTHMVDYDCTMTDGGNDHVREGGTDPHAGEGEAALTVAEMREAVSDVEAAMNEAAAGVEAEMHEAAPDAAAHEGLADAGANMGDAASVEAFAEERVQPGAHVSAGHRSMYEQEDKGFWGLSSPTCPPTPESSEARRATGSVSQAVPRDRDTMLQQTYSAIQHASIRSRMEGQGRSESHHDREVHGGETRASSQNARSSISPKLLRLQNELLAWRRSHNKLGAKTRRAGESLTEIGGKLLEALEYASASLSETAVSAFRTQ
jgi:hypothetical protein